MHGRVGDLETKVDASNHGVYSLMQAAVGDKSLVKEMIKVVEKCKQSGGMDCLE